MTRVKTIHFVRVRAVGTDIKKKLVAGKGEAPFPLPRGGKGGRDQWGGKKKPITKLKGQARKKQAEKKIQERVPFKGERKR